MKTLLATCLLLTCCPLMAQEVQAECRVLVAKEWITMGATSLTGCFRFADEASSPGERQFAKLGDVFLKVQGQEHFQSADGGNTWDPVIAQSAGAGFGSLNVLQSSDRPSVQPSQPLEASSRHAPVTNAPVKKKKRRRVHHWG